MCVPESTAKDAGVPLNVTLVAPVRLLPRIWIVQPNFPEPGLAWTKGSEAYGRREKALPQPGPKVSVGAVLAVASQRQ